MASPPPPQLALRAIKYDVARLRVAQLLVPCSVLLTIAARNTESPLVYGFAGLSQLATLAVFLSARRRYSGQSLSNDGRGITLVESGQSIPKVQVHKWFLANRKARVYGAKSSWMFKVGSGQELLLRQQLEQAFGAPILLARRGSTKARIIAAAVALAGVAMCVGGISTESVPLSISGALSLLFGWAAYGALSQQVEPP